MLKGYNDMNTNTPNPFVYDNTSIVLSNAGSSSMMSGLLTKESVLQAKSGNNPTVNYEEIQQMTGGNFNKMGTTNMSGLLEKVKNMGKGKYKELMKSNPTVGQIQDKLSKYM